MQSIELFAGAGGLAIGAEFAGAKPALVVERDKWCCNTINLNRAAIIKNWPEPKEADVKTIDYSSLEGDVDLVTGGPPCQPFSMGGKHKANDDQRDMWSEAVRAVRETLPKAFVFENVKGLMRGAFSDYTAYIQLQLTYPFIQIRSEEDWFDHLKRLEQHHSSSGDKALHYQVFPPRVLNAANFGIPQKRERVFFVGFRSDTGAQWSFPDATHSLDSLRMDQSEKGRYWEIHKISKKHRPKNLVKAKQFKEGLLPWVTVRDALVDLPDPEIFPERAKDFKNHKFQPGARAYPGHTGSPLDLPAKALKAGVHGVPGGENMLVRTDGSIRYFSIRESARLQTFPDSYEFSGSWSEAMRQIGNAVPVKLAETIISSVIAQINGLDAFP